jgi:hypothetical protein
MNFAIASGQRKMDEPNELVEKLRNPECQDEIRELQALGNSVLPELLAALQDPTFVSSFPTNVGMLPGHTTQYIPLNSLVEALEPHRVESVRVLLEPHLQHQDPHVRFYAAVGYGNLGLDSCIPTIKRIYEESDIEMWHGLQIGVKGVFRKRAVSDEFKSSFLQIIEPVVTDPNLLLAENNELVLDILAITDKNAASAAFNRTLKTGYGHSNLFRILKIANRLNVDIEIETVRELFDKSRSLNYKNADKTLLYSLRTLGKHGHPETIVLASDLLHDPKINWDELKKQNVRMAVLHFLAFCHRNAKSKNLDVHHARLCAVSWLLEELFIPDISLRNLYESPLFKADEIHSGLIATGCEGLAKQLLHTTKILSQSKNDLSDQEIKTVAEFEIKLLAMDELTMNNLLVERIGNQVLQTSKR